MSAIIEYDPLDYENLARSVVGALLETNPAPLPPEEHFEGSGVYALYYAGGLDLYKPIASKKCKIPIYVGKAIPSGGRKGTKKEDDATKPSKNTSLKRRLGEHSRSIEVVKNLDVADFRCRYLVVKHVWITLAERFLINSYRPVWNVVVDGFGNHKPGSGRDKMIRPRWDTIHPGREWAMALKEQHKVKEVSTAIRAAFK